MLTTQELVAKDPPQRVVVTDFDVRFWYLVWFIIKFIGATAVALITIGSFVILSAALLFGGDRIRLTLFNLFN